MGATAQGITLQNAEDRPYQASMAAACRGRNSLLVLPTGLGKTIICARVIARHLEDGERILVVAPTRPLVEQHARVLRGHLPGAKVTVVTGRDAPAGRGELWTSGDIVVATPQVARNDLVAGTLPPAAWGLLVVDEAHRAVGNYAAVDVAAAFHDAGSLILGATASPGSDVRRLQEVCQALHIEHVEARGEWDEDVAPYVETVSHEWVRVVLPKSLERAAASLRRLADRDVDGLRRQGLYSSRFVTRKELLKARKVLAHRTRKRGVRDPADHVDRAQRATGRISRALKLLHAVNLVETQSASAARAYVDRLLADEQELAHTRELREAHRLLHAYLGEHPKMRRCAAELQRHLRKHRDARVLVFVQFRETAQALVRSLRAVNGVEPGLFVGQGGDGGLTQDQQVEVLDRLREGELNVLVCTSVGEEGLDVPHVDLVVFYEPVASAVRSIQRKGRTGRQAKGRVVILMARGTSDEAIYWSAQNRERRMRALIAGLRRFQAEGSNGVAGRTADRAQGNGEADLDGGSGHAGRTGQRGEDGEVGDDRDGRQGSPGGPRVLVDHRELNAPIVRLVVQEGIQAEPAHLPVGDIVVSNRVVIERKTARDFLRSLFDGRLMEQARSLKRNFEAPVLLVEGDPFVESDRVRPASVAGAIAALTGSFGITVLTVADAREAALVVASMAKREHDDGRRPPALRHGSAGRSLDDQQRYLLEGLPQVSSTLARRLLAHFGTPGAVFAADEPTLRKVQGIGPTTARAIREVIDARSEATWPKDDSKPGPARGPTTPSGTGAPRLAS